MEHLPTHAAEPSPERLYFTAMTHLLAEAHAECERLLAQGRPTDDACRRHEERLAHLRDRFPGRLPQGRVESRLDENVSAALVAVLEDLVAWEAWMGGWEYAGWVRARALLALVRGRPRGTRGEGDPPGGEETSGRGGG